MSNSIKDKLLLFRIRVQHDSDAFGKIYDTYVNRIHRFIYFKVSSAEEAEDLTAETFLRLWTYLQEGKPVKYLSALTYQIARNLVTDYYRTKPERLTLSVDEQLPEAVGEVTGEERIDRIIQTEQVERALRLLKDEYREILIMRYLDELSPREIAATIGKAPGATRVMLHRALQALKSVADEKK